MTAVHAMGGARLVAPNSEKPAAQSGQVRVAVLAEAAEIASVGRGGGDCAISSKSRLKSLLVTAF